MNFTVLGGRGFVGRHLVRSLRSEGHEVFVPERDKNDWNDQDLGHVFYCIGLTSDFRTRPFDTMQAHVSRLADVLQNASFESLVYLSSTRIYENNIISAENAALTVNVSDPSDLYNISKLAGESLCLSCGRTGVKVARLSNVVGNDAGSSNFLFSLMREALAGHIKLQSAIGSTKDYILLEDVVNLLPRIAVVGKASIYNVASGTNISHGTILGRLTELAACSVTAQNEAPLITFPPIDNRRIRDEFGFKALSVLDHLPQLFAQFAKNEH